MKNNNPVLFRFIFLELCIGIAWRKYTYYEWRTVINDTNDFVYQHNKYLLYFFINFNSIPFRFISLAGSMQRYNMPQK